MIIKSTGIWHQLGTYYVNFEAPDWDQEAFHGYWAGNNRKLIKDWAKKHGYDVHPFQFYDPYVAFPNEEIAVLCHMTFSGGVDSGVFEGT